MTLTQFLYDCQPCTVLAALGEGLGAAATNHVCENLDPESGESFLIKSGAHIKSSGS
jgi:hypothetical protein